MSAPELTEVERAVLDQRLAPYINRINELKRRFERKEMELLMLKLAYDNIIGQMNDVTGQLKKQKSIFNRSKAP